MNSASLPSAPLTLVEALENAASTAHGVAFHDGAGACTEELTYGALRDSVIDTARRLVALGLTPGSHLGIIAETGPFFLKLFYACQYAGIVACPLPFTHYAGGKAAYFERMRRLSAVARLAMLAVPPVLAPYAKELEAAAGLQILTEATLSAATSAERLPPASLPDDLAYIQYSSGSTAEPKGVPVTHRAVCINAAAICLHGLALRTGDRASSWLPFYHDMGLVGFSIAPLFGPCSVDYLSPASFARRPHLWLELMSRKRSTITYAPGFGYRLAAQRHGSGAAPLDLSCIRVAGIGGDMINAAILDQFIETFHSAGFHPSAFLPSYGMAEAVLAVTFADLEALPDIQPGIGMAGRQVSCGRPLPGIDLIVVDEGGVPVAAGRTGHIWLRGPSVIGSYFNDPEATAAIRRRDGFIDSGDLGYLHGGSLFITGRSKDLIIQNGRNIWPQDIEWAAENGVGLRPASTAAFSIAGEEGEGVVLLVESSITDAARHHVLRRQIATAIAASVGVSADICFIGMRSLPYTSSGKLSRSKAKELFLQGKLTRDPSDETSMKGASP